MLSRSRYTENSNSRNELNTPLKNQPKFQQESTVDNTFRNITDNRIFRDTSEEEIIRQETEDNTLRNISANRAHAIITEHDWAPRTPYTPEVIVINSSTSTDDNNIIEAKVNDLEIEEENKEYLRFQCHQPTSSGFNYPERTVPETQQSIQSPVERLSTRREFEIDHTARSSNNNNEAKWEPSNPMQSRPLPTNSQNIIAIRTTPNIIAISSDSSNNSQKSDVEHTASELNVASSKHSHGDKAILDSGASSTTFRNRSMFKYLRPVQLTVNTASKASHLKCHYAGPVSIFKEAFWIPDLNSDLISLGALDDAGIGITIKDGHMIGTYKDKILFNIPKKHNIWRIDSDELISILDTTVAMDVPNMWWAAPIGIEEQRETKKFLDTVNRLWMWHRRLFHASIARLIEGLNKGVLNLGDNELISNLKEVTIDLSRFKTEKCGSCAKAKSAARPRPRKQLPTKTIPASSITTRIINPDYDDKSNNAQGFVQGYIATDMCGPFTTRTIKGSYVGIQVFLDMGSKWSYPYFYKNKSDAITNLKDLVTDKLKRDKIKLQHYHSDGADELCGAETRKYLNQLGVQTSWTSPSAPQENSIVERHFGTMMRGVVAMFEHARYLPKGLWNYAVEAFSFMFNRIPTTTGKGWLSPYEYRNGKPADLSWLKVWGCKMYVNIPVDKRAKNFNPRAKVGYLVGYSEYQKNAYKIWIPSTNRITMTRDAIADEAIPTGDVDFSKDEYWREARQFTRIEQRGERKEEDYYYLVGLEFYDPEEDMKAVVTRIEVEGRSRHIVGYYKRIIDDIVEEQEHHRMHVAEIEKLLGIFNDDDDQALALMHSDLTDIDVHYTTVSQTQFGEYDERLVTDEERNISEILSSIELPELQGATSYACALESAGIKPYEPTSYKEAMACEDREHWKLAIQEEHKNLYRKEVLAEVVTPAYPHRRIGSKYVFKIKMKNGVIDKYKVRIVAKGYNQILDLDYNESFAPVARFNTLRIFLAISLAKKHKRKSIDVVAAYLNSPLSEELYLETPDGMACQPGHSLKLMKALYGLKQAGRNWYIVLKRYLTEREGYTCCLSEHCVFIHAEKDMLLIVYVDDLIISGKDMKEIEEFIARLKETFELGDPTELDWYLGIGIRECSMGIFLTQENYIEKILEKYNYKFSQSDTIDTPMVENLSIIKDPADELYHDFDIKSKIGSLMFASVCTRPDITYAVSYLARYTVHPNKEVCKAIDRVYKYLSGTKELGIFIPANDDLTLRVFCDSDYGGDKNDYKSTSGVVVYLGQTVICWYSSKQSFTAQSSCDAEIVAMNYSAKEIVWLRGFLAELGITQDKPTKLLCDNQGAIQLAHNPVFHKRTKHIMIKFSYLVEQLKDDQIILNYIKSADNISDILTKAEKATHFLINRKKLNMQIVDNRKRQN